MSGHHNSKILIYQVLPRLFGNHPTMNRPNGTIRENGSGKWNDFDSSVLNHIKDLGFTHIWFTGVIRHATVTDYSAYGIPCQHPEVVKGKAGSPYAITDYYDVDPDLAVDVSHRMTEWEALIARVHQVGLKVVMDFVPNHVAREYKSICKPRNNADLGENDRVEWHFSPQNNFYYCWGTDLDLSKVVEQGDYQYRESPAKATGNNLFNNRPGRNDWYETVKLNYGIDYCDVNGKSEHFNPTPDTWNKMNDVLLFWMEKGVDAFRCDMAEMVPTAFWHWAIRRVKSQYPDVLFIGEVYSPCLYRQYLEAGFDYLYDKVGMYDCVRDVICQRKPASAITKQWQNTDDIQRHLLYFLENHDEQRIASDYFAGDARKGIPGTIVSALLGVNPFMIYAGQEVGEHGMNQEGFSGLDGRTSIFDYWRLDSLQRAFFNPSGLTVDESLILSSYKRILTIAHQEKAIREGQFFDLMYMQADDFDSHHVFTFLRKAGNELLLIAANFSEEMINTPIIVPDHAFDFLSIQEGVYIAWDLYNGGEMKLLMQRGEKLLVEIPSYGGVVLKIVLN